MLRGKLMVHGHLVRNSKGPVEWLGRKSFPLGLGLGWNYDQRHRNDVTELRSVLVTYIAASGTAKMALPWPIIKSKSQDEICSGPWGVVRRT